MFRHTRWTIALMLVSLLMSTMALAHPSERGVGGEQRTFSSILGLSRFDVGSDSDDDSDRRRGRRGRRNRGNDSDDDSDRHGRRRRGRDRDDDSDFRGRQRRVRDRDNDFDRGEVRRIALENGFRQGFQAGRNDRSNGRDFDFRDQGAFRDATSGYRNQFGDVEFYRRSFREGFRQGYEDGFEGRNQRRRRDGINIGDILGGVIGRP